MKPPLPTTVTRAAAGLLTVVFIGIAVRVILTAGTRPSFMWDTPLYTSEAEHIREQPVSIGAKWGYAAFLAAVGRPFFNARPVVHVQQALGLASDVLAFLITLLITRSTAVATIAGLGSVFFFDLRLMEITIMTETVGGFLVLAAVAALGLSRRTGSALALAAAGAAAFAATAVRPNLVTLVPVVAVAAVMIAFAAGTTPRRKALGAAVAVVMALGMIAAASQLREGYEGILNYVGFPRFYRSLPPSLAAYKRVYVRAASRSRGEDVPGRFIIGRADGFVMYYLVADALVDIDRRAGRTYPNRSAALVAIADRCIRARPGAYAAVWRDTAKHWLAEFRLEYGLYERPDLLEARKPQLSGWRLDLASLDRAFWGRALPIVTVLGFFAPPVLLAFRKKLPRALPGREPWFTFGACWFAAITVALLSISLQPCPGVYRYRMPIQPLLLILAIATIVVLAREARSRPG